MNDKNGNTAPYRKAAIYVRVSTSYQIDKDSLPMQKRDLEAYCELILGIADYVVFEDAGYSGKNTDRPAFQNMMSRIKDREFTHLLVWKIDRISRNLLDFSEMYSELKKLKVVFVSKQEQFDTSTAIGEAMLKIILVFAELERNMTVERVTATMISRASQGLWNGGRVPYGYDYDPEKGEFSVREDEASICRILADDYLKNRSLVHTAQLLNEKGFTSRAGAEWSATTVWIIASSPFYAGIYRYNRHKGSENRTLNEPEEWVVVENHHPAIFTKEEHERMLAILEGNKKVMNTGDQHNRTKHVYVFGRMCYCGKCGSLMSSQPGRKQADGYQTAVYTCPKKRKTKSCDNPAVNDLIIGEFVVNYISNILNAKKSFNEIDSPGELNKRLLRGQAFKDAEIQSGLNELYNLLAEHGGVFERPKRKAVADPEVSALKKDRARQERAMQRLNDLYLYAEKTMSEKDYLTRKMEIMKRIEEINRQLGMKQHDSALSDEEFIRKASHLLISSRLQNKAYIYYKNLASSASPDILREYMKSIIDSIELTDGRVTEIVFRNGISNKFAYKKG